MMLVAAAVVCCLSAGGAALLFWSAGDKDAKQTGTTAAPRRAPYEGLPDKPLVADKSLPGHAALQKIINNLFYTTYSPTCWEVNRWLRVTAPTIMIKASMTAASKATSAQRKQVVRDMAKALTDSLATGVDLCDPDAVVMEKENGVWKEQTLAETKTAMKVVSDAMAITSS